jgi:hypothetical protein
MFCTFTLSQNLHWACFIRVEQKTGGQLSIKSEGKGAARIWKTKQKRENIKKRSGNEAKTEEQNASFRKRKTRNVVRKW